MIFLSNIIWFCNLRTIFKDLSVNVSMGLKKIFFIQLKYYFDLKNPRED